MKLLKQDVWWGSNYSRRTLFTTSPVYGRLPSQGVVRSLGWRAEWAIDHFKAQDPLSRIVRFFLG